MAIALSVLVGERGANGVPIMTGRVENLRGRIDSYEHTIADRYGYEGMRCGWNAAIDEIAQWARYDQLMRPCEVYSPKGRRVWEGTLVEIKVTVGRLTIVYSLKDMANRMLVRYSTPGSDIGTSAMYSSASSIALFGARDRLLSLSGVSATAAEGRAQTELADHAFPKNAQPSEGGGAGGTTVEIQLTFKGWAETLEWLLTTNTSTTETSVTTQLAALLASYNAVNNWFSLDTSSIEASLPADTEAIEPDTTFREKFDTLLARGNAAHQRLHWGFYDDRTLLVRTWAGATPETIGYYESSRRGEVRDPYGNVVDAWDLRPDVMAQITDFADFDPPAGAIESATRKYVMRVVCKISGSDVTYALEPGNVDNLENALTSPTGSGPAGSSARQAAVERVATQATRARFPSGDNPTRYSGGVWAPKAGGTGKANTGILDVPSDGTIDLGGGGVDTGGGTISTGGGSILTGGGTIDTGGHDVSYPTSGTGVVGAGTIGRVAEWIGSGELQASSLIKSGAGVVTIAAASTATLTLDSSIRLNGAGATAGDVLAWNGTAYAPVTLTPGTIGAPSGSGTTGRVAEWGSSTSLQASTLIKTGAGVVTIAAASTLTLTLIGSATLDFSTPTLGDVLTYNGTKYISQAPALGGSGTTGRVAEWGSSTSLQASTLIKTGAGVLTIAAASTQTLTISGSSGGTLALGGNTLTLDNSIRFANSGPATGNVLAYDGTKYAPSSLTPASVGAAPDDATYIVKTAASGLSAEFALSTLATGLLKVTTTTGALTTATAGDLPNHASRHGNGGADEVAIDAGQITTGTVDTARLGSGTANSGKYLAGDNTWQTTPTGTVGGTGTAGRAALWASGGANVATSNLDIDGLTSTLTLLTSGAYTITFPATGTVALLGSANTFTSSMSVALGLNIGGASGAGTGEIAASGLIDAAGGFYVSGTKIIGARRTGWGGPTGTATRTTFATSTVTLPQLAERLKALIDDLSTHGIIGG